MSEYDEDTELYAELLAAHLMGECDIGCLWCHEEAEEQEECDG